MSPLLQVHIVVSTVIGELISSRDQAITIPSVVLMRIMRVLLEPTQQRELPSVLLVH